MCQKNTTVKQTQLTNFISHFFLKPTVLDIHDLFGTELAMTI
jgi:hypothetical protein